MTPKNHNLALVFYSSTSMAQGILRRASWKTLFAACRAAVKKVPRSCEKRWYMISFSGGGGDDNGDGDKVMRLSIWG